MREANSSNNDFNSCVSTLIAGLPFPTIGVVDRGENDKNCGKYWVVNQTGENSVCSQINSDLGNWVGDGGWPHVDAGDEPQSLYYVTTTTNSSEADCFDLITDPSVNNFTLRDDTLKQVVKMFTYNDDNHTRVLLMPGNLGLVSAVDVTFEWGSCLTAVSVTNELLEFADNATQAQIEVPLKK